MLEDIAREESVYCTLMKYRLVISSLVVEELRIMLFLMQIRSHHSQSGLTFIHIVLACLLSPTRSSCVRLIWHIVG